MPWFGRYPGSPTPPTLVPPCHWKKLERRNRSHTPPTCCHRAHLRPLKKLLDSSTSTFRNLLRTSSAMGKLRVGRDLVHQLRKAADLVEELSPRTEFLDNLVQDFKSVVRDFNELEVQANLAGRS